MKGADILISALVDEGCDTIFGYPGGAVLEIYDAIYKEKRIKHILTAHEQGAAHAADGYARATGKVGVCLATSGPGATNLVTGIATAYMDSVPVVAITGNVSTAKLGKDSFQEVDIAGITMPVTKHNFIVKDVTKLKETIYRAFEIARNGRPGPVLVDVTTDVIEAECEEQYVDRFNVRVINKYNFNELKQAALLINYAKRPLIYVGGGAAISGADKEIQELADKCDGFVCDSLMGKGVFPGDSRKYLGMTGIHGREAANEAVSECDLLVAIGVRFSDRAMKGYNALPENCKIIHIDIDPAEINKNVGTDISLVGDAKDILKDLNELVKEKNHPGWAKRINSLKAEKTPEANDDFSRQIIDSVYEVTNGDALIVTEVGSHQMKVADEYIFKAPRTLLTSGGLGTMGFGLSAAIGAKIAEPKKTVVNFAGDGCFRMNMAELATASRYGAAIIEIVFNNRALGLVQEMQDEFCDGRHSCTDIIDDIDMVKIAEGLGAKAIRVNNNEEFLKAFKQAIKITEEEKKPFVIECVL
ncbi:MAG: biosynthetic-type acetolactate synthase large subunit [Lachnospiraceae bacterium]|nr:biosynthetic-type acetolactate synthase large subunit [Lachnospiraceae bacterium]